MAEEQTEKGAEKKSHLKLWVIPGLVMLILAGGGGYAGWTMMAAKEEDNRLKPPHFMVIEPFIITLKSDSRPHYLQLKLSLMSRKPETIKTLEIYRPMIRNEIIRYLGTLTFEEVKKPGASDSIRENGLNKLLVLLEKEQVEASIEELVITDMVIQ